MSCNTKTFSCFFREILNRGSGLLLYKNTQKSCNMGESENPCKVNSNKEEHGMLWGNFHCRKKLRRRPSAIIKACVSVLQAWNFCLQMRQKNEKNGQNNEKKRKFGPANEVYNKWGYEHRMFEHLLYVQSFVTETSHCSVFPPFYLFHYFSQQNFDPHIIQRSLILWCNQVLSQPKETCFRRHSFS